MMLCNFKASYRYISPQITGLTLHGEKRLQINIQLEKTGHLT